MKKTLTILLNTFFLVLLAQAGIAQSAGGGGGRAMNQQAQVEQLISQLGITAEQEPAFREAMVKVNELRMGAMQQARGGSGQGEMRRNGQAAAGQGADEHAGHGTAAPTDAHAGHGAAPQGDGAAMRQRQAQGQGRNMDAMMERRAQMQKQSTDLLSPVLNEEQLAKYAALEEARMAKMMERRAGQQ